ncbi:cobalamin biosynthesis-related protein [Amycolatopsis mediterranei S699]|uniref:Cobalamin biosynthesis-related protein n=2 Tax=Amycolatopsis mediterranei TaxID=33910 RepID=A0A0H3DDT7_AMYMU|nr:sirohydrochlorin chelatase [Amycolatopsis mediterranei]ADJ48387.1 cobalamin biosynthesis-related protein [Amycolatopsis mediterranei U32]AEK45308.1 cobalamin biosynthesis-related protein [Amycolatopsis mediterranei S699]AFO80098.1 cobalamin biosynthesis-related protein [Amycolatopsis mediterranei S699]AGT87226.1 cobalamin biosynthesis-related protein [Amycolatopsis mediterranei RB]KDO10906.1 cobalamin biosynthesis protein [Amycolatopsis mediterranei]
MTPPLVAVAHGSRDPRSAATVRALVDVVRTQAPGAEVHESFLDLSEPRVTDVLRKLHADGHRTAVVVPLLLGSAFHARVDLPALIDEVVADCPGFRVQVSDVLGADPALEAVALDRLAAAPRRGGTGVIVSAVGSSNASANAVVASLASRWEERLGVPVSEAFASATQPDIPAAAAALRARGVRHLVVASWFLAPGLLPDRIAALAREADPKAFIAEPLADDPRVADVVVSRYASAVTGLLRQYA